MWNFFGSYMLYDACKQEFYIPHRDRILELYEFLNNNICLYVY